MAEGGRVERPRLIARRVSTALPSPIGLTFRMLIALLQRVAVRRRASRVLRPGPLWWAEQDRPAAFRPVLRT